MSEQHVAAERLFDALFEVPDTVRARKEQEQRLSAHMTGGKHICLRGFWRIGKTTLLRGILQAACERSGGAALFIDLRDPDRPDGLPASADAVLARITAKVQDFLGRVGATELKADPAAPLHVLGELAAPLYVGVDELIALGALPRADAERVITALLTTPKNVKVAVVCHRHRDCDGLFEATVLPHPNVVTEFVLPISDDELVTLVNGLAGPEVTFENETLGVLAELSGNRPWELITLAALACAKLPKGFTGSIKPEAVDALVSLDVLGETEEGQALVDNVLRVLVTAMTAEERALVELLATGGEGEVPEEAVQRLAESGWVGQGEGLELNGGLMAGIAQAVASGDIAVSVG
jgi:hypothetical protein